MKKSLLLPLACFLWFSAIGQQFQNKETFPLPPGTQPLSVAWADVNNDSLLDILLAAKVNGRVTLIAYRNPGQGTSPQIIPSTTPFKSGTFVLTDFNKDNKIDIVFSGTDTLNAGRTELYLNQGSFIFQKQVPALLPGAATRLDFSDLNNDAQHDLAVISTSGTLTAFKNKEQQFTVLFDSTHIKTGDIAVFDFDGNGFNDLLISGENQLHQPFLKLIEFRNAFDTLRTLLVPSPVNGKIQTGDLNHDGYFDFVVSGENSAGRKITQEFLRHGLRYDTGRSWSGMQNPAMRIADFDSDGKTDLALQGIDTLGTAVNWIDTFSGTPILLPVSNLLLQSFGDYDRDGDLDIVQVSDTLGMTVLENKAIAKNKKPSSPSNALGAFVFKRLFLYWQASGDDRTPTASLTYDLSLFDRQQTTEAGEFDLATRARTTVSHGNQGTHNFSLLTVPETGYSFQVQAVDNAFVGSALCSGIASPGCLKYETHTLTLCKETPVAITSKQPELWFSFSKGFLGKSDSLLVGNETDTLFSFTPQNNFSCNLIKVYLLEKSPADTLALKQNVTACEGAVVTLFAADEWQDVVWKDAAGRQVGTRDTLYCTVTKDETFVATGHNKEGCHLEQTVSLRMSKPVLAVNGEAFKILKGESVSLVATGAQAYWWQPPQGLNNPILPDPVATPDETTTYTVTGYDSLNCKAEAKVLIEVSQTAFVPNLFTPNGDGKNDELRIYGLYQAKEFYFAIHNREGNIVYESRDLARVVSQGWDGSDHGTIQPPGLYYWKIEGSYSNGSPLYLNGKKKGSILLVR